MRVKSHWFKPGAHGAGQQAGALGFILWRAARHTLQNVRDAGFDIETGPAYFAFLRETLVFLIAVADRIAHARMDAAARREFTTALVLHCADTYEDNAAELLGPRPDARAHRDAFIDAANLGSAEYAEFGAAPGTAAGAFAPDFGFLRLYASRAATAAPPPDERWLLDRLMAIDAPAAVDTVGAALHNLMSIESRPARRAGVSGD